MEKTGDDKKGSSNSDDDLRVLSIRLYTNRGRRLIAQASQNQIKGPGKVEKDGVLYERVGTTHIDSPLGKGTLKGFFGRADETNSQMGGILRLGFVWGDVLKTLPPLGSDAPAQDFDYGAQADQADFGSLQRSLDAKNAEYAELKASLQRSLDAKTGEVAELKAKVDSPNNLAAEWHNAIVFVLHPRGKYALDFAAPGKHGR